MGERREGEDIGDSGTLTAGSPCGGRSSRDMILERIHRNAGDTVSHRNLTRCRLARFLPAWFAAVVVFTAGVATAQNDDSSHRRLSGGRGFGDLRAQTELLERLQQLTNSQMADPGTVPFFDPDVNPGVADPEVQQALQQMLSQQLLEQLMSGAPDPSGLPQPGPGGSEPGESVSPDEIDVNDPRVQEILRRLPPETRQPIEDMIRQNNPRQSPEIPRGPYPNTGGRGTGREPSRPLTPQDLEQLLSGRNNSERPNAQPGRQPGRNPNSRPGMRPGEPEDPQARAERIAQISQMLDRMGMNGGGQSRRPGQGGGGSRQPGAMSPREEPSVGRNRMTSPNREPSTVREQAQLPGHPPEEGPDERPGRNGEPEGDIWEKLGRVINDARERGNEASSSGDAEDGARSALARAIEEAATDLAGRAEELFQDSGPPRRNQASSGPGFFDRLGRGMDSVNDRMVRLADGGGSGGSGTPTFGGSGGGSSDGGSFSLMSLVIMSLILTTCIALFRNRDVFNRQSAEAGLPPIPRHLRNRGDVVRAFHALAARFPEVLDDWWPHRRAAVALAKVNPQQKEAINTLAGLYEEARYMPEDAEFSEQQLESARGALRRFGVS